MSLLCVPRCCVVALVACLTAATACKSDPPSASSAPACNSGEVEWPDDAEPLWNNITVTQVNREQPRASLVPFDLDGFFEDNEVRPYRFSLNGPWRFHFSDSPAARPMGFEAVDFDDSIWDTIDVPSNVEMLGYGDSSSR
ncbi:MAG: hypothetical protein JRF54_14470 [Deltaproteobacteria bacterium]|nr:hypothetical protein [Deltaproteobacteria bacterium]